VLGRFFLPAEDQFGGRDAVAVISTPFWQRRFGSDPAVIGRAITINGVSFRIVGIAPEEFPGPVPGTSPNDLRIPTMMLETGYRWCNGFNYDCTLLSVIGRLRLAGCCERRRPSYRPLSQASTQRRDMRVHEALPGQSDRSRSACPQRVLAPHAVNGRNRSSAADSLLRKRAGLLLGRSLARRHEIAVRLSIGARHVSGW
jgi:hypothetical protein